MRITDLLQKQAIDLHVAASSKQDAIDLSLIHS